MPQVTNLVFMIFLVLSFMARVSHAVEQPNIILMMADDMGMGDTSAYQDFTGNSDQEQIHTPHLERLAQMGVRFTDAHTSSSRCTPSRYALLTGRYPWRSRMKHWVLFGAQGDPLIERDRPTLATMLQENGYRTAMVGKWHVGLRYRRADGTPAAGFTDADLRQPLYDSPLDHGFEQCWLTSRSHGTSGPQAMTRKNRPDQTVGPGHLEGRVAIGATDKGRQLTDSGPHAYLLKELGKRHSDHALSFLENHIQSKDSQTAPFFLYYPANSNHAPYTPSDEIDGIPVAGAARNKAGELMNPRSDYIYENDVALGRMLDFLEAHDDPRHPGRKLIETTMVIFTSDNGAEKDQTFATGPFRSNKGSCYEGGHRVPFIVALPSRGIGDGNPTTSGKTNHSLIGLQDLFATFAELTGTKLPDLLAGEKGAEDSVSILSAMQGKEIPNLPKFYHDHKQAQDAAASAMRYDNVYVDGAIVAGKWKIFFDADLLRKGGPQPTALYDLLTDPQEEKDRLSESQLQPLVKELTKVAEKHRNSCGHAWTGFASDDRIGFSFTGPDNAAHDHSISGITIHEQSSSGRSIALKLAGKAGAKERGSAPKFSINGRGLGISSGQFEQIDAGESLLISFDQDLMIESVGIVAGNGICGGSYQVGENLPIEIYCTDADIDAKDQSGLLSDIGLLKAGEVLTLNSTPIFESESPGRWRLNSINVRLLRERLVSVK